jgi:hypothetical protein
MCVTWRSQPPSAIPPLGIFRGAEDGFNAEPAGDGLGGRVPQIRRRLPARRETKQDEMRKLFRERCYAQAPQQEIQVAPDAGGGNAIVDETKGDLLYVNPDTPYAWLTQPVAQRQ